MSSKSSKDTVGAWGAATALPYASVRRILKAAIFTACGPRTTDADGILWGLPLALVGSPGGSKSAVCRDIAWEWFCGPDGRPRFRALTPGATGDGGFGVTPVPAADEVGDMYLTFPPPEWVREWRGATGLVLTDDMVWTPPTVQAAQLDFVQRRVLGEAFLGGGCRVIGATNDVAQGGFPIPPAQRNRMVWLPMPRVTPDDFGAFMFGAAEVARRGEPYAWVAEEARVLAAWPEAYERASMLVVGFVTANPARLNEEPTDPNVMAWATPRSVEMATRAVASSMVHNLDSVETNAFIAGCVGQGWANEFEAYVAHADLPSPADLLDGKATFEHRRERLDRTYVVVQAMTARLVEDTSARLVERGRRFINIVAPVADEAADLLAMPLNALSESKAASKLFGLPEFTKLLVRMEPAIMGARRRR